ncbi:hypothetical protein RND71_012675 [Anisodus tanguticus]|uniref:Uncharacterized protein n=1 Tax=Anisodus tanguticus TaxID=243964 RepID=A0AAE1SGB0_9SOLA|nr:hypothetical protein RND71_012675 [Anisodus tanguticus]
MSDDDFNSVFMKFNFDDSNLEKAALFEAEWGTTDEPKFVLVPQLLWCSQSFMVKTC